MAPCLAQFGWANGSDLFGFVDIGSVYSTFPERVSFASAGAAIKYSVDEKASLEIGVGFPLNTVVANQSDFEIYTRITVANF
jgi:hemolysin activation/secretion protein